MCVNKGLAFAQIESGSDDDEDAGWLGLPDNSMILA